MNIYLKLEIKHRDFLSRLLLGMYCASKGHEVLIGDDKILQNIKNDILNPGIFLEKSITPSKDRINQLRFLRKKKFITFSLDEESGLLAKKYETFKKSRFSNKSLKLVNKVLCWGKFDYKQLKSYYKSHKNKFAITGNTRVDLWRNKFDELFVEDKKKQKNSVLISSNFLIGVSKKRTSDYIKTYKELGYFDDDKTREYVKEFHILFSFQLMLKFLDLIDFLTKKYPKVKFVLRPHPNEDEKIWRKLLNERENLIITKSKNIAHWIINSKIVIHNGCMGGIEAFARVKNVLSFRPLKNKLENDFANSLGQQFYNIKQVDDFFDKFFNKDIKPKNSVLNHKEYKDRFRSLDKNEFNYQSIYNEFFKFNSPQLSKKNNYSRIILIGILRKFKRLIIKKVENPKFQSIEFYELENAIRKFKKIIPELQNVNFKLLDENIIRIYARN